MGGPLGIWVILLANWLGNRTYFGAGAPTEKGAVALSHFGFVRQLLFSLLQYAKNLKERELPTAVCERPHIHIVFS